MDPRWWPWCWAAGAAGCAVVCWLVQPWRQEFHKGWELVRKYPAAWVVPALLAGLDVLAAWGTGEPWAPGPAPARPVILAMAESVREGWHGWTFGPGAGFVVALLLAWNAAGLRRGFLKGVESVTGWPGGWALTFLFIGAAGLLADVLLRGRGLPVAWHVIVSGLSVPLMGWVSAAVWAGLLLLAETLIRAPEKMGGVRWLESAAAHAARLWPWGLAHGLGAWLVRWLPDAVVAGAGLGIALLALGLCFAPLMFLHVKQASQAPDGFRQSLQAWSRQGWQVVVWLGLAGMLFFAWNLTGQAMTALVSPPWQVGVEAVRSLGQIALTVLALGAWVALRLAGSPPPARSAGRPRKASPP
jgi:hypothetical protein